MTGVQLVFTLVLINTDTLFKMSLSINNVTKIGDSKSRQHFIPLWLLVLVFAIFIGLFFIGRLPLIIMPSPLMIADEVSVRDLNKCIL